jgi:hypothetical protein
MFKMMKKKLSIHGRSWLMGMSVLFGITKAAIITISGLFMIRTMFFATCLHWRNSHAKQIA